MKHLTPFQLEVQRIFTDERYFENREWFFDELTVLRAEFNVGVDDIYFCLRDLGIIQNPY